MISWILDPVQGWCVLQSVKRPMIYLDHWAIREFAQNPELANRFGEAIVASQGTWTVSLVNLMEFIAITDEGQAAQFEALLEQVLPNLFFIDFHVFDVINREDAMLQGGSRHAPYGDASLLKAFADGQPAARAAFITRDFVTPIVRGRQELVADLHAFKNEAVDSIHRMRAQTTADKNLARQVDQSHRLDPTNRTRFVLREVLGDLLRDQHHPLAANDAIDFFHAVVPLAYCDFVLLDGAWEHRINTVIRRLRARHVAVKAAQVFSKRNGGLERFFRRMQSFPE